MKQTLKRLAAALIMLLAATALAAPLTQAASRPFSVGSKKYATLQEAIENATSGQTVKLNANATLDDWLWVEIGGRLTLDLNKKTLSVAPSGCLSVEKGTLIVQNGSMKKLGRSGRLLVVEEKASLTITSGTYAGVIDNRGTTTIAGGTFTNLKTNRMGLLQNEGTLTISGGTFTESASHPLLQNDGTLSISKGTFTTRAEDLALIINEGKGKITITGGTFRHTAPFDGESTDIYSPQWSDSVVLNNFAEKGKIVISGGSFTSNGMVLATNGGTLQIKNGTFISKAGGVLRNNYTANTTITGGKFSVKGSWGLAYNYYQSKLIIKGGTFTSDWSILENYESSATITVSGGTFSSSMNKASSAMVLNFGGKVNLTGGTFTGKKTNGYWIEAGKVTVGSKVKLNAKAKQLKGDLIL